MLYFNENPEETSSSSNWEDKLSSMKKKYLIRALSPDQIISTTYNFISQNLSLPFVSPPTFNLLDCY